MWYSLNDMDCLSSPIEYGETIYRLSSFKKYNNSIKISDTIVLSSKEFNSYYQNRFICDDFVDGCVTMLRQLHISEIDKIDISMSFWKECNVDSASIVSYATFSSIKNAITALYERWFDGKPYAYRIANKMIKEETYPAIYIQPHFKYLYSIITRHPSTGKLLFLDDWSALVHCSLPAMSNSEKELVSLVDKYFITPQKIYFYYSNNSDNENQLCIKKLENYNMTRNAYVKVLIEKHKEKLISDEDFIRNISPTDIIGFRGKRLSARYLYNGLCLSTGYSCGKAVFLNSNWKSLLQTKNEQLILFTNGISPEDIEKLKKCAGVISSRGGISSHEGVLCRGFGIPALSCSTVRINDVYNTASTLQETIKEGDNIYLSCFSEKAIWGKDGVFEPIYVKGIEENPFEYLIEIGNKLRDQKKFVSLSLDFQIHFAKIFNSLKLIGYKT